MAFDQYLTCQIFPLRWACFPIKTSRIAQWIYLFSMILMISLPFTPFFSLNSILNGKIITQWVHHIPAINCDEGIECYSTRIELFYFDANFISFRPISFHFISFHLISFQGFSVIYYLIAISKSHRDRCSQCAMQLLTFQVHNRRD